MSIRIKFFAQAGDIAAAMLHEAVSDFDEMPTEKELAELAEEFMWESVSPEAWWEVVE